MIKSKSIRCFLIISIALASVSPVFAGGQAEDAEFGIAIPPQPRVFIAPGVADAEYTELQLNPDIAPSPDRIIRSYELVVFDPEGNAVYSQREEETATRGFFGNLFNIGDVPQIDPDTIRDLQWDGTDDQGAIVPDGDYIYQLFVTDDEGRTYRTPPQNITVDTEPPTITRLSSDDVTIFSPGVEGGRQTIEITQAGSVEVSWVGHVLDDSGNAVRTYQWENPLQYDPQNPRRQNYGADRAPESFQWDGMDDDGNIAPDGVYSYRLTGRDRPGNSVQQTLTGIRVATEEGDVTVTSSREAFNPQGRFRTIVLSLEVLNVLEIDEWRVEIMDSTTESQVFRAFSGSGAPPQSVTWDGRNDNGVLMPDNTYHVVFTVVFENGVPARSLGTPVAIDTVAPSATVAANHDVFGGETKRTLEIDASWDSEASWAGLVQVDGTRLRFNLDDVFVDLNVTPDLFPIEWDGRDLDGTQLPDGPYTAWLEGTDAAGNVGESNRISFVLDTRDTPISVEQEFDLLSPDFQGVNDQVFIRPILEVTDSVESLRIVVRSTDGEIVRTFTSSTVVSEFSWDGRDDAGNAVAEGSYEAELQVFYRNGNQPTAITGPIAVDRDAPQIDIRLAYNAFAPNGDGYRDTLPITVVPAQTAGLASWSAIVADSRGTIVRSVGGVGVPPRQISWDGRTDQGDIVDGRYRIGIRLMYEGGGQVEHFADQQVLLDATGPDLSVTATPIPFRPEFNGRMQNLTVTLQADDEWSAIRDWRIELIDPMSNTAGVLEGTGEPPARLLWDGRLDDGRLVQSAVNYTGRLTVRDELRNVSVEELDILTDIIVREENGRLRIVISSIEFEPNSPYLFERINERLQQNLETLRNLGRILNQFSDRDIVVEGHANHIRFRTAEERRNEQRDFLIPLSRQRATQVRDALAILGVDIERMTIRAIGGSRPVVPFDDFANTWQNRRVEFLLDRPNN